MEEPTKQDLLLQLDKMKLMLDHLKTMVENYSAKQAQEINSPFKDSFETILLEKYHIDITELREKNRNGTLVMLRYLYCYGLKKYHNFGLEKCGLMAGYADHSNAIYAINKVEDMLKIKDALFMEVYANFEHIFKH